MRTGRPLYQSTRRWISWIFPREGRQCSSQHQWECQARGDRSGQFVTHWIPRGIGWWCTQDQRGFATKSCSLDPVPTSILEEVVDVLLPYHTHMCNASLSGGQLPVSQRQTIITPLLKESSLDPAELKNYWPVTNLTFMSKIVEELVSATFRTTCWISYLQSNNLMPRFQSAYRRHHSTETAILRVISDIVSAVDRGSVTLLGLLDLSAASDTVDHTILLDRLRIRFGVGGGVLEWIRTFLVGRKQQVLYNFVYGSSICRLNFGAPHGSVLGPLLSLLYTDELFEVIKRKGLLAHSYADDTQVHLSVPASESSDAARQFPDCIEEIDGWMQSNRLKMNTDKTQLIWIGTRQQLSKVGINEIELRLDIVSFSTTVSDLCVIFDNQLMMTNHVAVLHRSCFFQLRQIRHQIADIRCQENASEWVDWTILQFPLSGHQWRPSEACTECRCWTFHVHKAILPYHCSSSRSALASNSSKNRFQTGDHGLRMSAWFVSILPGRELHPAVCHSWLAAPAINEMRVINI